MKSLKIVFIMVLILLGLNYSPNESEAAYSAWHRLPKIGSTCEVRIWTDATNYYSGATTVDWFAQQRGNCGRLDYTASIETSFVKHSQTYTGYFNNQTPTRSFNITSAMRKIDTPFHRVWLWVGNSKVNGNQPIYSAPIYIH